MKNRAHQLITVLTKYILNVKLVYSDIPK